MDGPPMLRRVMTRSTRIGSSTLDGAKGICGRSLYHPVLTGAASAPGGRGRAEPGRGEAIVIGVAVAELRWLEVRCRIPANGPERECHQPTLMHTDLLQLIV